MGQEVKHSGNLSSIYPVQDLELFLKVCLNGDTLKARHDTRQIAKLQSLSTCTSTETFCAMKKPKTFISQTV